MNLQSLFKKMKKRLNNQKGFVSLVITTLALIAVLIVSFLLDRTNQNFMMQEVRGIMDSAAQNTLLTVLSDDLLKEELFGFTNMNDFISGSSSDQTYPIPNAIKTQISSTYSKELNNYVGLNDTLLEVEIEDLKLTFAKGKWGLGNKVTKSRPYLVLDSVVQLRLNHSQSFDYSSTFQNQTFKDAEGNSFEVKHIGTPTNSEILLIVRSVSRAVFR